MGPDGLMFWVFGMSGAGRIPGGCWGIWNPGSELPAPEETEIASIKMLSAVNDYFPLFWKTGRER